ncbi:MAG: hypothetical protein SFW66_05020, partial [Gammaproteobacteria bacterium]|nr:hypothetical protein [Gammaproteobacteria bacterium]
VEKRYLSYSSLSLNVVFRALILALSQGRSIFKPFYRMLVRLRGNDNYATKPFEKGRAQNASPFEKGGLRGIYTKTQNPSYLSFPKGKSIPTRCFSYIYSMS